MITVEAQGIQYEKILSVECGGSLGGLIRDFSIIIARPDNRPLPFKGGEAVKIRVDGELFINGVIFRVFPSYTRNTHSITMSGRSLASNFVDSTLLPFALTTDITLENAILKAIEQIGLSLSVTNNVKDLELFQQAEDKIAASVGENAFKYADKLARKRQVLLTSDANGNIIIDRTGTEQINVSLRNIIGGADNNILDGSVSYDLSERHAKYFVLSQLNETAGSFGGAQDPAQSANQRGEAEDAEILNLGFSRQFVMEAEKKSSNEQCNLRATWEGNIRRTRSREYSVVVQGVRPKGGKIWEINKLIPVNDEYADINDTLLIDSVRFLQSRADGTKTKLGLTDKEAYQVSLDEPPPAKKEDSAFVF